MNADVEKIKGWLGSGSINVFGMPFAGKDTQAHKLADLLGGEFVGSGEILRNNPDQATVARLMSTGKLYPTDFYLKSILPYVSRPELKGKSLILSSVGRWDGEQEAVVDVAAQSGHPIKAVVLLNLSEDETRKRWEVAKQQGDRGQRHDDAEGLLDTRLEEFRVKTLPVIDFYRQKGLIVEVDGKRSRDEVTNEIINRLAVLAS